MTGGSGNPGAPAATLKPKLLQQVRDAILRIKGSVHFYLSNPPAVACMRLLGGLVR